MTGAPAALGDAFATDRDLLWGLCYRMTGCAADADDLVQETFARALERPPPDGNRPWRPWLVRVAMNLARDALRRRRRRAYTGPWLPSPIETPEAGLPSHEPQPAADARYERIESFSFAFLLALEALRPQQRAVLLLRDVFDYSVRETAAALDISPANVKTTLHRARRAMRAYDRTRLPITPDLLERTRRALERFAACMATGDTAGLEALLAEDVQVLNDGAGEFAAARVPVTGRARVARFHVKIARGGQLSRAALRLVNGLPAIVAEYDTDRPHLARRVVVRLDLDAGGRVATVHTIVASRKLTAVDFGSLAAVG